MEKRGLVGIIAVFVILFLIILGTTYWFFIKPDSKPTELKTNFEIIPSSVFVNKELKALIFDLSIQGEFPEGFTVTIQGQEGLEYSKTFSEQNSFGIQEIILNYENSQIEEIKKISINTDITSTEYSLDESNFKAISCNNNGILDLGEECDDGNSINTDSCLRTCTLAFCGDNHVWRTEGGTEKCDMGGENSDTIPDACRTDCTLPICGDGVVDSGEECDLDNLGEFNVENACSEYKTRYGSGELSCNSCKLNTDMCQEIIRGLELNGIDQNIDISGLELQANGEYTFSVWLKPLKAYGFGQSIIGCTNSLVSLKVINGDYNFKIITDTSPTVIEKSVSTDGAKDNKWAHVTAVYSRSNAKIYLDGNLKETDSEGGEIDDDVICKIGSNQESTLRYFKGVLGDVRIYEKALTSKEILQLYEGGQNTEEPIDNLILWLKLDEGSGAVAKDSSDKSHDGSIQGSPDWITEEIS